MISTYRASSGPAFPKAGRLCRSGRNSVVAENIGGFSPRALIISAGLNENASFTRWNLMLASCFIRASVARVDGRIGGGF